MGHMDLPDGKVLAGVIEKEIKSGNLDTSALTLDEIDTEIRILQRNQVYSANMARQVKSMMKACNDQLHRDGYLPGFEIIGEQGGDLMLKDAQRKHEYLLASGTPSADPRYREHGDPPITYSPVVRRDKGDTYHDPVSKAYLGLGK